MRAPRWTGFLAGLLATGLFYPAQSQTTATLLGTIRESSGSVVPQARVTARHVLTSFTRAASTDDTGSYLIPNLPVGDYSLIAEKEGFRRFVQDGITLVVNQNARADIVLSVGSIAESVTVSSPVAEVDTRSVKFRTEFFNAWNQVSFGGPEARQTNRNFGRILSAGSPRIVQFALKYLF